MHASEPVSLSSRRTPSAGKSSSRTWSHAVSSALSVNNKTPISRHYLGTFQCQSELTDLVTHGRKVEELGHDRILKCLLLRRAAREANATRTVNETKDLPLLSDRVLGQEGRP
jgi:hypothetical protein